MQTRPTRFAGPDPLVEGVALVGRDREDVAQVVEDALEAVADLGDRLLLGLGDVHRVPSSRHARRSGVVPWTFDSSSMTPQCVPRASKPPSWVAATDSRPAPWRAAVCGPAGENVAATHSSKHGWEYGRSCSTPSTIVEPVGLAADGLAPQEGDDHLEALLHHAALVVRIDPEHLGVGGELARPDAEHHPTAGQVVEQDEPVGKEQRVVVGERGHAGAEPDVPRALRRRRR